MISKYQLIQRDVYRLLAENNKTLQRDVELASHFIKKLTSGSEGDWVEKLEDSNSSQNLLINDLLSLRQKLKRVSEEEAQRNWAAEGLAIFTQLIRHNSDDLGKLSNQYLSKLVQYVGANQGAVYVAKELDDKTMLEQIACYAYGRRKFVEKIIEPGEGSLGQAFLEGETVFMTDIPDGYVTITSGLGEATATCLVIVPLKVNDEVLGVLELASFEVIPPYVLAFLEKNGEVFASALAAVRNSEMTKELLRETQDKTQQMRAQEEELRQNLEELQATQEEMIRKQKVVDQKSELLRLILDNLPFPTFVKDENGVYLLVNKAQSNLLGLSENEIVGKNDNYFTADEAERIEIKRSDFAAINATTPVELPMQTFTTKGGHQYTFKTTKVSFLNAETNRRNIVGVSVDLSDRIKLERKMLSEKVVQQNNVMIDLAGRQRMLSQKIGFLCEMICRGQTKHVPTLRKAIDLHDHSLEVIKKGGWPMDIEAHVPLDLPHADLLPFIEKVENIWNPYKEAADKIAAVGAVMSSVQKSTLEDLILVIEEKGESLLMVNNQLVSQYKKITQAELAKFE